MHPALIPFYGQFGRPSATAIQNLVTEFRAKLTLLDFKPTGQRMRTEENIAAVSASVVADRDLSIRRHLQPFWKDLGLKTIIIQLTQELKPPDGPIPQRITFGE